MGQARHCSKDIILFSYANSGFHTLLECRRPIAGSGCDCTNVGQPRALSRLTSGQDPRAISAVRDFFKKLIDNEAVCSVTIGDKAFSFSDIGEVQRSFIRLGQDNLHEEAQPFKGSFQGCLPKRRTFEFKIRETGEVISGRIGPSVNDAGAINNHLGQEVEILLTATRVGQARPRFVLNALPRW